MSPYLSPPCWISLKRIMHPHSPPSLENYVPLTLTSRYEVCFFWLIELLKSVPFYGDGWLAYLQTSTLEDWEAAPYQDPVPLKQSSKVRTGSTPAEHSHSIKHASFTTMMWWQLHKVRTCLFVILNDISENFSFNKFLVWTDGGDLRRRLNRVVLASSERKPDTLVMHRASAGPWGGG